MLMKHEGALCAHVNIIRLTASLFVTAGPSACTMSKGKGSACTYLHTDCSGVSELDCRNIANFGYNSSAVCHHCDEMRMHVLQEGVACGCRSVA